VITPGLFDLQVNGYAGVDFNDSALDADALDHALHAMLRAGVTRCLPTIITAGEDALRARLHALDRAVARSRLGPAMVPGFHLEGPFLNPGEGTRGCHPPDAMVAPDPALLARLCAGLARPVRLLTIAPDRPGAAAVIAWARRAGMIVALGHHAAERAAVTAAADAGATLCTHLGNGLPAMLKKLDNPLMAQLAEDRLAASFIADGIHVPGFALKAMVRAKDVSRAILVTDATAGADAPEGFYAFAGMQIRRDAAGSVRLAASGALAGSALTMDVAVRNVVAWGVADAAHAVAMASAKPARLLGESPAGEVAWSESLYPERVRLGDITITREARA
jgi:N-acetylglucosamine-6-phosphate deacetylase